MINKENFNKSCEIVGEEVKISNYLLKNKHIYDDNVQDNKLIRCPFDDHNDGTPSFSFDDRKGVFNCFGCGRGGDVVNLHYHMKKIEDDRYSRIKAVKDLAKMYKVTLPDMFERRFQRGRVNKFRKIDRDKDIGKEYYMEKIRTMETTIRKLPYKTKTKLYREIDNMLLEI